MNTKNILKTLALAMLLVSACDKSEIANDENAEKKGFALPVTVNVTREGDDATKATFNDGTKKLSFSAGDKLLVRGNDNSASGAGRFAGLLDYDASEKKFSGTIYTENSYSGTADDLFTAATANWVGAALFPNGYDTYEFLSLSGSGYSTSYSMSYNKAIAATKAAAVEQFSLETAKTYSSGFALSPENAILNFTITGLTDGEKAVTLMNGTKSMFTGSVTPSSGTAAFALGARIKDSSDWPVNLKNVILTIGGTDIDITDANNNLAAGKIYNITRSAVDPNAPLPGIFSISAGQTVQFSKGNLQYQASTDTWRFAEHQYDYVGNAAGNNTSSDRDTQSGWIDLFGWGTSGKTFASGYGTAYQPWTTSTTNNQYGPTDGTSGLTGDYANGDWGVNMGTGWRTLTSGEWSYLFNTRTTGGTVFGTTQARYTEATINTDGTGVNGIILFPDGVGIASDEVTTAGAVNNGSSWATKCTTAQWAALESKGCVFLPAAGYRSSGTSVTSAGSVGVYWSSTPNGSNNAYALNFMSNSVIPVASGGRRYAGPVRLVQEVVTP